MRVLTEAKEVGAKESACNTGDLGSIPESERSPGEGNGNPPQYSCLKNPMDREAWKTTGHKESDMAEVTHTQGLSESPLFKANKHRKQINSKPLRMVI